MREMQSSECVTGLKCNNLADLRECKTCLAGEMTRAPFTKRESLASDLLEIVHSDVCGPVRVNSLAVARFFITFIDDRSRWCQIYFMKNKSEVIDKFKEFKCMAENLTGQRIKALQSDNGREYCNGNMDDFLRNAGISRRLTMPHTP